MSLATGVLIGSALLVGLAAAPFGSQRPARDIAIPAQLISAHLLSIDGDLDSTVSPGPTPLASGMPKPGYARLRWTAHDWRCARQPAIESPDLMPWRLASAPLELSTKVPDTY